MYALLRFIIVFMALSLLGPINGQTISLTVARMGYLFDPFSTDQTWTVSSGETPERIYQYLSDNKWVTVSLQDFKTAIGGSSVAAGQSLALKTMLNLTTEKSKEKALRKVVLDQTGIACDPNPGYRITENANRLTIAKGASTGLGSKSVPTSTILALWVKEGSMRQITSEEEGPFPDALSAEEAFVQLRYYNDFGGDYFTLHVPKTGLMTDNALEMSNMAAARANYKTQVASVSISTDFDDSVFTTLSATDLSGGNYTVNATDQFTVDVLETIGALWSMWRVPDGEDLTYIRYNSGQTVYNQFRQSILNSPTRASLGVVNWSIHSPVVKAEWGDLRRNAIRFYYYRECYLQYDN